MSIHKDLEGDLPAEDLEVLRVLGTDGAGAGCSGRAGWSDTMGLSAGVLAADDDPLSKINVPRPARGTRSDGNGANPEPSGSPASGELQAGCFPFLTRLQQYSWSLDWVIVCQSVFLVTGFCLYALMALS